jgi:hypothetical protein
MAIEVRRVDDEIRFYRTDAFRERQIYQLLLGVDARLAGEGFSYKHVGCYWVTSVQSIAKYMLWNDKLAADDITVNNVMSMITAAREDWHGSREF